MGSQALLWILLLLFIVVSGAMVLIILVQRPQGGGLAGAFGGSGATSSESVFGGRIGDALSWATVAAFALYILLAIGLNIVDDMSKPQAQTASQQTEQATDAAATDATAAPDQPA